MAQVVEKTAAEGSRLREALADSYAELEAIRGLYSGVREEKDSMSEELVALEGQYMQLLQDSVRAQARAQGCESSAFSHTSVAVGLQCCRYSRCIG